MPRRGLLLEPLTVQLEAGPVEPAGAGVRVSFVATVSDSAGMRAADVAVEARVAGPDRTGQGTAVTDRAGRATIRMTGSPGRYRCEVIDVAGGAMRVLGDGEVVARLQVEAAVEV